MAFPRDALPMGTELLIGDQVIDISADVNGKRSPAISVQRGRSSEAQSVDPTEVGMELRNFDGRYSPRNPRSALFGQIGRNTPIRTWVELGQSRLVQDAPEDMFAAASTPAVNLVGSMTLTVDSKPESWRPVDPTWLGMAKSGQFGLFVMPSGQLGFAWSEDGAEYILVTSAVQLPDAIVGRKTVRAEFLADDGNGNSVLTFSYATGKWDGSTVFIQLGNPVVHPGVAQILAGDGGLVTFTNAPSELFRVELASGVGGGATPVAGVTWTDHDTRQASITDPYGNVWVAQAAGTVWNRHYRHRTEVTEWPQKWGTKGAPTSFAPIKAHGVMRRLGQGRSPVESTLRRGCRSLGSNLVAYWPFEDSADATQLAVLVGTYPGIVMPGYDNNDGHQTPPKMAAYDGFVASNALPTIGTARISCPVPPYVNTSEAQVRWLQKWPSGNTAVTPGVVIMRIRMSGTIGWIDVVSEVDSGVMLKTYRNTGSVALPSTILKPVPMDSRIRWSVEAQQSGTSAIVRLVQLIEGAPSGLFVQDTIPNISVGSVTSIDINPDTHDWGDTVFGHLTVEKTVTSIFDLSTQFNAYWGERADTRAKRLAAENDVPLDIIGTGGGCERMGHQRPGELLSLLRDAADSETGTLFEPRDAPGLRFRTLEAVVAQDPVRIVYTDNLLDPFEPVDDDQATRNRVEVQRAGGGSALVEDRTSALSVLPPEDGGVGIYDTSKTLSLATDMAARQQAGWLVHLGTVDEARWPRIGLDLAHPYFLERPALTRELLSLDIGDRLEVSNLPPWLPPFPADVIVQGIKDDISPQSLRLEFSCTPARPYEVGSWVESGYRLDTVTTTLPPATLMTDDYSDPSAGGTTTTLATITARTATSSESASATTVTATRPSDRVAGDYHWAVFAIQGTPGQITGPGAPWSTVLAPTDNGAGEVLAIYEAFSPSSDAVISTSAAANRVTAFGMAWGGVDTGTPRDATGTVATATATSVVAGQVTTATAGAVLLSVAQGDTSSRTWAVPGGMTTVKSYSAASSGRALILASEARPTIGATGSRTWAFSPSASLAMAAINVALRPATITTGSTPVTTANANSSNSASGSSTTTVTKPTGTVSGDLLVAITFSDSDGTWLTAPAGFTQQGANGSSAAGYGRVFTKAAGGSEPANYTFTGVVGSAKFCHMIRVPNGATLDVTPVWSGNTSNTTTHTAPSVTPTRDNELLICATMAIVGSGAGNTWTPPSGMTELTDQESNSGYASTSAAFLARGASTAGVATGTKTFTGSHASINTMGDLSVSLVVAGSAGGTLDPNIWNTTKWSAGLSSSTGAAAVASGVGELRSGWTAPSGGPTGDQMSRRATAINAANVSAKFDLKLSEEAYPLWFLRANRTDLDRDLVTAYYLAPDWMGTGVAIGKSVAGTRTAVATIGSFLPSLGDNYSFRFEAVTEGTNVRVRARVWLAGTTEPSTWDAQFVDTTSPITAAGYCGPNISSRGPAAGTNKSAFFDNVAIRESVGASSSVITRVPVPAGPSPWRWASDHTFVKTDLTGSATSLVVDVQAGPKWTTTAGDLPLTIRVAGEDMTVTAVVDGAGTEQTFTVVRAVNGIVKSHTAGTKVELANPAYLIARPEGGAQFSPPPTGGGGGGGGTPGGGTGGGGTGGGGTPTTVKIGAATYPLSGINPTAETNPAGAPYPGARGPDQLVIYRDPVTVTVTNEWGVEVQVDSTGHVTGVNDRMGTGGGTSTPGSFTASPVIETQEFPSGSGDIADDSAIWRNPSDPSQSWILADDKADSGGGIASYDLTGTRRQFLAAGKIGNIDVRDVTLNGSPVVLVGVNNRTDDTARFYTLNTSTGALTACGSFSTLSPNYGFTFGKNPATGKLYALISDNNTSGTGQVQQYELNLTGASVTGTLVRTLTVGSLTEGMACDDTTGRVYVGEEDVGLWRYSIDPAVSTRTSVDNVSGHLVADVEGISVARNPATGTGQVIVSSQGNSTIHVYDADTNAYQGVFTVGANGTIDAVTETDGVSHVHGSLNATFPAGLIVVHDSTNSGGTMSNLKFVRLDQVLTGLGAVSSGPGGTAVPADGYVLSGHGAAYDWLIANATIGALVELTGATGGGTGGTGGGTGTARRSTLPWDLGVFGNLDGAAATAKVANFAAMAGVALDYVDAHPDWAGLDTNDWWYAPHIGRGYNIQVSCDLYNLPTQAITADNTAKFTAMATRLRDAGWNAPYIRMGVEFNLNNDTRATDANAATWIARWQANVNAIRAVLPAARFVLSMNEGNPQSCSQSTVDNIVNTLCASGHVTHLGPDYYDQWEPIRTLSDATARFGTSSTPGTMNYWLARAKALGVKLSIPEWGVSSGSQWAGHTGGDNPFYINYVLDWCKANADTVTALSYFEEPASYLRSDITTTATNPNARAAFQAKMTQYKGTTAPGSGGGTTDPGTSTGVTWPIRIAANRRYLEDSAGKPFFVCADTGWTAFSALLEVDAQRYVDTKAAQGFNTILCMCTDWQRNGTPAPAAGYAFNSSGSDITSPIASYWDRFDRLLDYAKAKGMLIFVGVLPLSDNSANNSNSPGNTAMATYATWLANRWKDKGNIIYFMGGDAQYEVDSSLVDAGANALNTTDANRHLITFHPSWWNYNLMGTSWLDFNSIQWNDNRMTNPPYALARTGYELTPTTPWWNMEPPYVPSTAIGGIDTTPQRNRQNGWWSVLGGAFGVAYGGESEGTWSIGHKGDPIVWSQTEAVAGNHTGNIRKILTQYPWQKLVPNWDSSVVTSSRGTYGGTDYVAVGRAGDGSLIVIFKPVGGSVTVALGQLAGAATAKWYDPANGNTAGSPVAVNNTGSQTFTPPASTNSNGGTDWVLVISTATTGGGTTDPGTGGGGTTTNGITPYPAASVGTYKLMWSSDSSVLNVPTNGTELRLAFGRGDPPILSDGGWSAAGQTAAVANLAQRRQAGQKIIWSIGGEGGTVNTANRSGFVNGVKAFAAKLAAVSGGGLDGLDWDIEVGSSFPTADVIAISSQLKADLGANFAITMAPNGNNKAAYRAAAAQMHAAGCLDNIGQQYYDAPVSLSVAIGNLQEYINAGIPASKMSVGMFMSSNVAGGSWSLSTCVTNMTAIRQQLGIRRCYLWTNNSENGATSGAAFEWVKAMRQVVGI
jgi:myo-inositol-hexaphosphate 3-phosphohydrolase